MSANDSLSDDEINLFRQSVGQTRQFKQDKIQPQPFRNKQKIALDIEKRKVEEANFYFSDAFEPNLNKEGPMAYIQTGFAKDCAKRLRRGDFYPEFILDLHGLKREQAKLELAGLIQAAIKQHVECVCVVHGLGTGILKQKIPHWLVQHPKVIAFHQAPLENGGQGALLVLIDLGDESLLLDQSR